MVASLPSLSAIHYATSLATRSWHSELGQFLVGRRIVIILILGGLLSLRFWDELGNDNESLSTTIRNVGLLVGGVAAALLAVGAA